MALSLAEWPGDSALVCAFGLFLLTVTTAGCGLVFRPSREGSLSRTLARARQLRATRDR